jgi:homoserine O-succinyltransferase/O-acetyltransferase
MPLTVVRENDLRNVGASPGCIEIGLVNNMPDTALKSTEAQFAALLEAAAGDLPVRLRLFTLPLVPRSARGARHLGPSYLALRDFWDSRLDALIVTGTEPRAAALADEPYWPALAELIEWAGQHTISTVWSCLAAHAAVFHLDGIVRHPLGEKRFGVFDGVRIADHPLTEGLGPQLCVPNSRWNELREEDLRAAGYDMLTRSPEAGVDTFVREGRSLFVFFQGHPEYDAFSLLGEYRRDLGRFLRGERETCPALPRGYFTAPAAARLEDFAARARADRREDMLVDFPLAVAEGGLRQGWREGASRIYANWLAFLAAQKALRAKAPAVEPPPAREPGPPADGPRPSFIDRRGNGDPASPFSGPRDRRRRAFSRVS